VLLVHHWQSRVEEVRPVEIYEALQRQFERLHTGLGKSPDFQVAEIQLQQLRLTMQRRSGVVTSPIATAAAVDHGDRSEASTSSQEDSTSLVEPESASCWVIDARSLSLRSVDSASSGRRRACKSDR